MQILFPCFLRHCLIEHIQQNELYVTNDVCIGNIKNETDSVNTDGMLLYGTNAVGKTSLIRALGISVIMAQSGMYVPCSSFKYKPYTAIFSRILCPWRMRGRGAPQRRRTNLIRPSWFRQANRPVQAEHRKAMYAR